MKKLLIIAGLLLLIVVVVPFIGGAKAKTELDRLVAYLNVQPGYKAQWQSYERGWLKTSAVLLIESSALAMLNPEQNSGIIPVDLELNHGPVLVTDGFKLGWFSGTSSLNARANSSLQKLELSHADEPVWQLDFKMGLSGETHFADHSQEFALNLGDERVEAGPYSGRGNMSVLGHLTYSGDLTAITFKGEDAEVSLESLHVTMDTELQKIQINHNFAPGDVQLSIAKMQGSGSGINDFSLKALNLNSVTTLNDELTLADILLAVKFEELALETNQINQFNLNLGFENISLNFIRKYTESMAAMNDPAQAGSAMGLDILGLMSSDLIPAGPKFNVKDFSFQSDKGDLKFSGAASVPPKEGDERVNPFALFQAIGITAQFEASKDLVLAMLAHSGKDAIAQTAVEQGELPDAEAIEQQAREQANMQLDLLKFQGMLVEKEGDITAQFSFKDGLATVNGQPMPLPF